MIPSHRIPLAAIALLVVAPAACGQDAKTDSQLQADIVTSMHALVLGEIQALHDAAVALNAAAPATFSSGWDPSQDSGATIDAMKVAWTDTRTHWERIEGTVAPIFPDLDDSMDSRYEELVALLGDAPDPDPFDGEGMIGMHAIERILYAPGPLTVANHESTLPGYELAYQPAVWPASDAQAADFKNGICQRLLDDTQTLLDRWKVQVIDLGQVFTGLTGQMSAQEEKVGLTASGEQESRYSQTTMADLRANLDGTRMVYDLFGPWLATKPFGTMLDDSAMGAFIRLDQTYQGVQGDAIPDPPSTWSIPPSLDDSLTPFGALYLAVTDEVDPSRSGSAVDTMNQVARALGLPEFTGQN